MAKNLEADTSNIFFRCVEDSSEAIMISNQDGILVYVNPAWCQIYGYSKSEAIGKTPRILHSGLQSDSFYREMWAEIRNPKIGQWKGDLINKAKDGTFVPVLLSITQIRSHQTADVTGYMGIALDMTYRKEMEAKIAHQDRLASIGLLASGLAHEIGTPLGVIRGRAELLTMRAQDPILKKDLSVITSEIDRITKLIRSLLSVSRNFSDVRLQEIDPLLAAQDVLDLVGQHLREDQVEIELVISPELRIKADHGRLEQVFLNLIMNSIHAIKQARKTDSSRRHFLRISSSITSDRAIEISVEDTGCGISAENMKKLFKPFFTTKDVGEGTGLGLAIVAQLMREMGGEIKALSTLNKGTTFVLRFQSHSPLP